MEILTKKNVRRDGNLLIIELPESFVATELDVMVYPSLGSSNRNSDSNISDFLASLPEISEQDIHFIEEKRKHLNLWI